ncbi:MAG: hypothetical protein WBE72_01610 [Terracidiphilus sp.]
MAGIFEKEQDQKALLDYKAATGQEVDADRAGNPPWADPRRWLRSVFGRKHDPQYADGLLRVGRVFAATVQRAAVIVDLPEDALAVMLEGSEIALSVRVVVRREHIEVFNLLADPRSCSDTRPCRGEFFRTL